MNDRIRTCKENERTVLFSINPKAGRSGSHRIANEAAQLLETASFHTCLIDDLRQLDREIEQAKSNGSLRAVVAVGGDGTVSMLANRYQNQVPIAILPAGTENLMAKYLELGKSAKMVAETIIGGKRICLDSGIANGKPFLVMASCGFDAEVVSRLHRKRDGHIRHLSYAEPIVGAISHYRYPKVTVIADGQKLTSAKWAFVFNVPRYAMQLPIVDDASPFDGELDVCTFRGGKLLRGLTYLFGILTRQHRRWKDIQVCRATRFRIESNEKEVPFQIDGDPGGFLPLEIEVVPASLDLFVPVHWLEKQGFETKN